MVHVNVISSRDVHPFETDDVALNRAADRNWQTQLHDIVKVTQVNLLREKLLNVEALVMAI